MSYRSYSISVPSSIASQNAIDLISTQATSEGWTLVESRLQAFGKTWAVLFNPATLNSAGIDFYVGFWRNSSATAGSQTEGEYGVTAFLDWNTNSKTAGKIIPSSFGILPVSGTWFAPFSQQYLPNSQNNIFMSQSGTAQSTRAWGRATNATPLRISTNKDRIAISATWDAPTVGDNRSNLMYAGLFDSFYSSSIDAYPICAFVSYPGTHSAVRGFLTMPLQTTSRTANFTLIWDRFTSTNFSVYNNAGALSRFLIAHNAGASELSINLGQKTRSPLRGLLKDIWLGVNSVGTVNTDTVIDWTFSGSNYVGRIVNDAVSNNASAVPALTRLIFLED